MEVNCTKMHETASGLTQGPRFYNSENFVTSRPSQLSFSIMYALEDGFSIIMYSGSHRVNLSPDLCLHHGNGVRIILAEWMMII